jgi:bifunctional ADP-heptose synthase (sugar kinase/adenylyltransferase)
MHDLDLGALLVTRGEHGMTLLRPAIRRCTCRPVPVKCST